jgi:hypothetical protein
MTYFRLFAFCKILPAEREGEYALIDTQRLKQMLIPAQFYDILEHNKSMSVQDLKFFFQNQFDAGIDAWFGRLSQEGFGHFTSTPECFPEIDPTNYDAFPESFLKLELSNQNFRSVLEKCSVKGSFYRVLILETIEDTDIETLEKLLDGLRDSLFQRIEITSFSNILYNKNIYYIKKILRRHTRVQSWKIKGDLHFDIGSLNEDLVFKGRVRGCPK